MTEDMTSRMNHIKKYLAFSLIYALTGHSSVDLDRVQFAKETYAKAYSQCRMIGSHVAPHHAMVVAYFVKEGEMILDVGAYVGDYSQYYGKLVGEKGKVIAYEANPYVFPHMTGRLTELGVINVTTKSKAASRTTGQKILMKVYPNELGPQLCTVEPDLMNEERMPGATALVEVETEMLDEVLKMNIPETVRFIKIDVEGHECAVLEGAQNLLRQERPLVIFEYAFIPGKFQPDTIQQVEEQGYICFDLKNDQKLLPNVECSCTDILAVPVELAAELEEVLPYLWGIDCR